ncbi:MAG: hypothetical protein BWY64_00101 [bacterium ADurb.Bin363]|nr:MAG: hypothetical protein BWY64_00101 [bacterium ADurb.Bin363]
MVYLERDDDFSFYEDKGEEDLSDGDHFDFSSENGTEDYPSSSSAPSYKGFYIKVLLVVLVLLTGITGGIIYYIYGRGKPGELSFIPEEAQIVGKLEIKPGIKKMLFSDQYGKLQQDPELEKKLYDSLDKLMRDLFFKEKRPGINITEEFLNYVDPEMAVAQFNVGQTIARKNLKNLIKPDVKTDNIISLGVFHINNKEKTDEFFKKVEQSYGAVERETEGYKIFISDNFSYYFYRDFVVISSRPEVIVLSIKTVKKEHKSILTQENFQLYRKGHVKDAIGFIYVNLNYLRQDFCSVIRLSEDSNLVQFLNSLKLIGTSIAIYPTGVFIQTLIMPEENITSPIAVMYFSQIPREPKSLRFLPEDNTSNVIAFTNLVELFQISVELLKDLSPDISKNINKLTESKGFNMERDVLGSLTGDLSISVPVKNPGEIALLLLLNPGQLFNDTIAIIGIKKDSRLASMVAGADTLISFVSTPVNYRGVKITKSPDNSLCYAFTEESLLVNTGNSYSNIEKLIATKGGEKSSLYDLYQKRTKKILPSKVISLFYINLKQIYNKLSLNSNQKDLEQTFEKCPEIWIVTTRVDKGMVSTIYIPFILQ